MEELKKKGYNSSAIRELNLFSQSTLTKFRNGQEVSLENIGRLCFLLDCNIGDILEYA
jgi:DNA-binding Xre family transcriptional regulator